MDINPLGVTMGVRDFQIAYYWIRQLNFIDRLEITGFNHDYAHQYAKSYFLTHPKYTHLLILCEDTIIPADFVKLLMQDYQETKFPVICGYSNIAFRNDTVNFTLKDMSKHRVISQEQYQHPSLKAVLKNTFPYPLVRVYFSGLCSPLIERSVMQRVSFKPYHLTNMMQDLQFSLECASLGIPIYVDLRLLHIHFGVTTDLKKRLAQTITLYTKEGETQRLMPK